MTAVRPPRRALAPRIPRFTAELRPTRRAQVQ